jgi:hypothetical protein
MADGNTLLPILPAATECGLVDGRVQWVTGFTPIDCAGVGMFVSVLTLYLNVVWQHSSRLYLKLNSGEV